MIVRINVRLIISLMTTRNITDNNLFAGLNNEQHFFPEILIVKMKLLNEYVFNMIIIHFIFALFMLLFFK